MIYSANGRAAWGAGEGECKGWSALEEVAGMLSELLCGVLASQPGDRQHVPKGDREMPLGLPPDL